MIDSPNKALRDKSKELARDTEEFLKTASATLPNEIEHVRRKLEITQRELLRMIRMNAELQRENSQLERALSDIMTVRKRCQ